ncbi:MAG: RNA polymerase sigma factor [Chitinophagaceae bacterium]
MTPEEEKEILNRIKIHPQDFALLYDAYYHPIFSYVFRRFGDYDLARDITAETFLKAYQKIDRFIWRGIPVSAWLYRIATNEINLYLRKRKYAPTCIEDLGLKHFLVYDAGIETEKAAMEKALQESKEFAAVQKKLSQMDIKYSEVIALRFFEEKQVKEIALILNKNEGTVKSLLSRGLEKLRKALEEK